MAFAEYAFLVKPTLQALGTLFKELKAAKGNDGKIDATEWAAALGSMFTSLWEAGSPLVREEDDT